MRNSGFLFSEPSFIEGFARLIDFGSTLNKYNDSESGKIADNRALKSDWQAIGNDIRIVVSKYAE